MRLQVEAVATIQGVMRPPSDKSLTHRAYMLAAIASGKSLVRNPLRSHDCNATLDCLSKMGLTVEADSGEMTIIPAAHWRPPDSDLNCGNSGTTMRLLSGLVASRPIQARLVGDESLSGRPMGRISKPLRLMGADFDGDKPPIMIKGSDQLKGISYVTPVASAQIKSCILLAGLRAEGETVVTEPSLSRDHTERMLRALGVSVASSGGQGPPPVRGDCHRELARGRDWSLLLPSEASR